MNLLGVKVRYGYLKRPPVFFRNAENRRLANKLVELCRVVSLEEFRKRLAERTPILERLFETGFWGSPLSDEDIKRFGTR